jgi:DNA polymerase III epsilon subunit-like protein
MAKPFLKPWVYCILDFETTWLDVTRDYPIQLALVLFDESFSILDTYSSYVALPPSLQWSWSLKDIVTYLTDITPAMLSDAPSASQILPDIQRLIERVDVFVGHNIWFDIMVLQHHFWPLGLRMSETISMLDTFPLSKALVHFLSSYSLSVVFDACKDTVLPAFMNNLRPHEALSDCYMNRYVFRSLVGRIRVLCSEYATLRYQLSKISQWIFSFLSLDSIVHAPWFSHTTLPTIHKPIPSSKKIYSSKRPATYLPEGNIDISSYSLHDIITHLPQLTDPLILSFSHKPKATIVQNHLHALGFTTHSLHDSFVFVPDVCRLFLSQNTLSEREWLFLCTYFSCYHERHMMMDVNSVDHYTIFHALTTIKPLTHREIVVTTHDQLVTFRHKIIPSTHVYFFDHQWRFSYAKEYLAKEFDLYHLVTTLEQFAYKYNLLGQWSLADKLTSLSLQWEIFLGILHIELSTLWQWHWDTTIEIENLLDHIRMPKTRTLFPHLTMSMHTTLSLLDSAECSKILAPWESFCEHGLWIIVCVSQVSHAWYWHVRFRPHTQFVGYDDALALLPPAHYSFLSHLSHWSTPQSSTSDVGRYAPLDAHYLNGHIVTPPRADQSVGSAFRTVTTSWSCIRSIDQYHTLLDDHWTQYIFVLSTSIAQTKALFNALIIETKHTQWCIVGEQVTWGVWASLHKAFHASWTVVIIGWFQYYLLALAKWIHFSHILLYHIQGKLKPLILHDMLYYAFYHKT